MYGSKAKLNFLNILAILSLLISSFGSTPQVFATAPEAGEQAQAAQANAPDGPEPPAAPGKPVNPALTGLEPQQPKQDRQAYQPGVQVAPQTIQPAAYDYFYEWSGSQAIADNACAGAHQLITLNVPASIALTSVHVGFNAGHTWREDVQLWLLSPAGTRVQLLDGTKGGSDDNFDVFFIPIGSTNYTANHTLAAPYYENIWAPQGDDLNSFVGQDAQGNWKIEVCDDTSGDTGTVYRWGLFLNYIDAPNLSTSVKSATSVAMPGEIIDYTILVKNTGEIAAAGTTVVDPLPAGVSFDSSATAGFDYNPGLNQMAWSGNVAVGGSVTLRFKARVDSDAACGAIIVNTATINAPGLVAPVTVSAETEIRNNVFFVADFEADNGAFTAGGSASSWAWGSPTSGPGSAHSGSKVWATNLDGNHNTSERSYLTSPMIDLSATAPAALGQPLILNWWQWVSIESGYTEVDMEVRGGASDWTTVYGPVGEYVDSAWNKHSVDISSFAGASDFQIRFHLDAYWIFSDLGWYIDDLSIVQCHPAAGLYLSPDTQTTGGCVGTPDIATFNLFNMTGSAGTFEIRLTLTPGYANLTGPEPLAIPNGVAANFDVTLTPWACLPNDISMNGAVTASGNSHTSVANLVKTVTNQGQWELKARMAPGGLFDHAVVDGGNGSLYAMGGNGQGPLLNLMYDSAGNTWAAKASLPTDLRIIDGGLVNGKIYLPGGYNGAGIVATTLAYDVSADTWATVASAPRPVAGYGVATCGGKLYRLGGALHASFPNGETGAEVYDPVANAWTALAPMSTGHTWPAAACIDDKLYVAGGIDATGGATTSTEVYDIASNTWSDAAMADLPIARWGAADFVQDGKLFIAGGIVSDDYASSVTYYTPGANTWSAAAPLSQARFRGEGDSGYATGGMYPAWTQRTTHEQFSPCPVCNQSGRLSGKVFDYDGVNPPATPAEVTLQPGNYKVPVAADGSYAFSLVPWTYEATASAVNYPDADGPHIVKIFDGVNTHFDFTLPRPDIKVEPPALTAYASALETAIDWLHVFNLGSQDLNYQVIELPPTSVTTAAEARPASLNAPARGKIQVEPQLNAQMALDENTSYLIYFRERPDLSPAESMDWEQRGEWVVKQLQTSADKSQARVRAYLDSQHVAYKSYWIDNIISVKSSNRSVFTGLQAFGEIQALRARRHPIRYEPVALSQIMSSLPMAVQTNLTHIKANQVWASGITGQGIVVANIDTGVNYAHEALVQQYRGNLGSGLFDHNYNWYDPASGGSHLLAPTDWDNHGSHTMGTMIGSTNPASPATAANTVGMAPGAEWIACRAFEGENDDELMDCGQFMAAPTQVDGVTNPMPSLRPHIISNSWGDCSTSHDPWYDGVIASWHALGIYPVFANGNSSNCWYASPPGLNTVGSPARAGNVTGVGATGRDNGAYATFSNWGPTDQLDVVNPRGYPRLKPQVVAPGTNRSAAASGNTYMDMSGTSMATPHVSGLIALMWSAAPCLVGKYAETETILEETAVPVPYASGGSPAPGPGNVPNYATGWGEIDAQAAVNAAITSCGIDRLPWVTTTPVTGTLAGGDDHLLTVNFSCTLTETQQPQPLTGKLRVNHNDPTQAPVDVDLQFYCSGASPSPVWSKEVRVNGVWMPTVDGPHTVRPGDELVITDYVGAAYDQPISSSLTETWGPALTLLSYNTGGVGSVAESKNELIWTLVDVAPNASYPIVKTFRVNYGAWITDAVDEAYQVTGETTHLANKQVNLVQYVPAIKLEKSGPDEAPSLAVIPISLKVSSSGSIFDTLQLTDTLPAGMTYAGGLSASYGTASAAGNTISWSVSAAASERVTDGGFEGGTPSTAWAEASTNFGTPLCDLNCGGPAPHSGYWHVWFGGIGNADETASVQQSVTIPGGGQAKLSFWLLAGVGIGGTGFMRVLLDGNEVFKVTEAEAAAYAEHQNVVLDVSAYADGGAHTLRFESTTYPGNIVNFFLDDVSLMTGAPLPAVITIGFNAQVSAATGAEIDNIAHLTWTGDYTSDLHRVTITTGQPSYRLSVTKDGTGNGAVSSSPGSIDCGSTCSQSYVLGTEVTLTAAPDGSSYFAGWGGACTGTGSCVATMNEAKNVSATFTARAHGLELSVDTASHTIIPGLSVTYILTIKNTGSLEDTFDLSLGSHAWHATLSGTSVTLAGGASITVTLTVAVPGNAGFSNDAVTVTATSYDDASRTASVTVDTISYLLKFFLPLTSK